MLNLKKPILFSSTVTPVGFKGRVVEILCHLSAWGSACTNNGSFVALCPDPGSDVLGSCDFGSWVSVCSFLWYNPNPLLLRLVWANQKAVWPERADKKHHWSDRSVGKEMQTLPDITPPTTLCHSVWADTYENPAHTYRCFQLSWMSSPLLRLKLGGATGLLHGGHFDVTVGTAQAYINKWMVAEFCLAASVSGSSQVKSLFIYVAQNH